MQAPVDIRYVTMDYNMGPLSFDIVNPFADEGSTYVATPPFVTPPPIKRTKVGDLFSLRVAYCSFFALCHPWCGGGGGAGRDRRRWCRLPIRSEWTGRPAQPSPVAPSSTRHAPRHHSNGGPGGHLTHEPTLRGWSGGWCGGAVACCTRCST